VVIALDSIEHLEDPHESMRKIFNILKLRGYLYASTANIGYFIARVGLFFGQFNYGKRGILDLTHKKLFTIYSFKKFAQAKWLRDQRIEIFRPPITDMVSKSPFFKLLEDISTFLAGAWPSLFAYNFLVVAQRMDDIKDIFEQTLGSRNSG